MNAQGHGFVNPALLRPGSRPRVRFPFGLVVGAVLVVGVVAVVSLVLAKGGASLTMDPDRRAIEAVVARDWYAEDAKVFRCEKLTDAKWKSESGGQWYKVRVGRASDGVGYPHLFHLLNGVVTAHHRL